ncbi:hypothetical protein M422DRAFT_222750 [Sphaerobolus stellatus SS14]|nr:hypothetical protein M422DRAFT_222750 [Sphaerobolus stellatus SS14]
MAPQQADYVRLSYVIPPPTAPPAPLVLPPLSASRHGSIRPLLFPANTSRTKHKRRASNADWHPQGSHPRHRLGVSSLALDTSTKLEGQVNPQGILYSGGRDGQILSWDLGLRTKRRQHPYGHSDRGGIGWRKGHWEILTGWNDDMGEEEEEDDEVIGSDGDVLGDVVDPVGRRRRSSQALYGSILPEHAWELDHGSTTYPVSPSTFRQSIQTHTDWVNDILLCNANQTVVSASSDGTVRAWSPHLSHPIDPVLLGVHDDYARCLAASPHQSWVASGSFDRTIKLWDISRTLPSTASSASSDDPAPLTTLSLPSPSQKASIYAIATDLFGSMIASGSPERVVRMWDPRSGRRTGKLVGHTDNIRAIILSDDGRYLLTGSADASIKLWSLASQRCLHTFTHHTESVWALSSQHPSLEVFYSGDRSGIVTRVDVEGCNSVDEGECMVICNATGPVDDGTSSHASTASFDDVFRPQDSMGVNKIVTKDDGLLWTATGSSSIKRWKTPPRRSIRLATMPNSPRRMSHNLGFSRQESISSEFLTHRRGFSAGLDGQRHDGSPTYSPGSPPRSGSPRASSPKHMSTSSGQFIMANESFAHEETTLYGIPYQSLVRLVSPNDPYGLGSPLPGGGYIGSARGEADVATLYSAASVKSIPTHVARHSHPPLSVVVGNAAVRANYKQATGNSLSPPPIMDASDAAWAAPPHVEYANRDLAVMAVPLESRPDHVIDGEHGIIRSIILNDRMHALTVNTVGCVAVWDIARCYCVGSYDRQEVLSAMGTQGTDRSTDSGPDYHSPREILETVRERIEGECIITPWSTVDTRVGNLTVHVLERCFETEIYADEAGYPDERRYDSEQRLNIGKWVISNLFDGFVSGEFRNIRRTPHASQPLPINNISSQSHLAATTSHSAISTLVKATSMIPAIVPDMTTILSRRRSLSIGTPLIPLAGLRDPLPTIPQSPNVGTPTPRPRHASETPASKNAGSREVDYFNVKNKRVSGVPTTPDDFSSWGGSASKSDVTPQPTPSTPSGGGFMGRLRVFGKSSKRANDETSSTPDESAANRDTTNPEGDPKESTDGIKETDQSRLLAAFANQNFHPPSTGEVPPLDLPHETEIVLAEETASGYKNVYRGTVGSAGNDIQLLESVMPIWLMQYLLANKTPIVPNIKVSFGVTPWIDKDDPAANQTPNPPSRLTANRYLRVRKILAYVQDKIDKPDSRTGSRAGSISDATPRSSMERSSPTFHRTASSHRLDSEVAKRPRPEDIYELLCSDVVLPLNMTLASIRHYIWRSSSELLLFYRRKA